MSYREVSRRMSWCHGRRDTRQDIIDFMLKRMFGTATGIYLAAALVPRGLEGTGAVYRCGCEADCWCERPTLTVFRWVFPYGHKIVRD
jgi:hypothetical protein